jgi:uncharacterized membrane protein (Fun14 family)
MNHRVRRAVTAFGARWMGRVSLALAIGAVSGQAAGANSRIVLAFALVGIGIFVLALLAERRAGGAEQTPTPSDP